MKNNLIDLIFLGTAHNKIFLIIRKGVFIKFFNFYILDNFKQKFL